MGLYLTVHSCPPHRVRAVLDVLTAHRLTLHDEEAPFATPEPATVTLDIAYQAWGISYGVHDVTAALIVAAPEVAFTAAEDPTSDYGGLTVTHVPELGTWSAAADHDQSPVFTRQQVLEERAAGTLDRLLGAPWQDAIAALPIQRGHVRATLLHDVQWDRHAGEITVVDAGHPQMSLRTPPQPAQQHGVVDERHATEALVRAGWALDGSWETVDVLGRVAIAQAYRTPADDAAPTDTARTAEPAPLDRPATRRPALTGGDPGAAGSPEDQHARRGPQR